MTFATNRSATKRCATNRSGNVRSARTIRQRPTALLLAAALVAVLGFGAMPASAHPVSQRIAEAAVGAPFTLASDHRAHRSEHRGRHRDRASRSDRHAGRVDPGASGRLRYDDQRRDAFELRERGVRARHRRCSPRRALRRAWRLGIDDPRIERIRRRVLVVSGYDGRELVYLRFARDPSCTILRVRYR